MPSRALLLAGIAGCSVFTGCGTDDASSPAPQPASARAPIATPAPPGWTAEGGDDLGDEAPPAPAPCRPDAQPCELHVYEPGGAFDYYTDITYREDGLVVEERNHKPGVSTPFSARKYTYDDRGRKIREEEFTDGALTYVVEHDYRRKSTEPWRSRFDRGADGEIDRTERYRYFRDGELWVREADEDGDGRYEKRRDQKRDETGRMLSNEEYFIGGSRYKPWEFEYDEHGHHTRTTQWYRDGSPDYWPSKLEHDACGNLLRSEADYKNDGDVDHITEYRYACDPDH